MAESGFFIVPIETSLPIDGWDQLDRSARLDALQSQHATLDHQVRDRLTGFDIDYLAGMGGWVVRSPAETKAEIVRSQLHGLPLDVADNDVFTAL